MPGMPAMRRIIFPPSPPLNMPCIMRELILLQLLELRLSVVLIDFALNLLDERKHVAHAQNTLRYPIGIERLERVILLADADEFHRLTSDLFDRQRRTTSRVAVHLCQDDPGDANASMKFFRRSDCVLSGHRIRNEKNFDRMSLAFDRDQLLHQLMIDVQAAGRVDQKSVIAGVARML